MLDFIVVNYPRHQKKTSKNTFTGNHFGGFKHLQKHFAFGYLGSPKYINLKPT